VITHDPAGRGRAVRMHALAQRATLEQLPARELAETVRAAAGALVEVWPDSERGPDINEALRSNTSTLTRWHAAALEGKNVHPLLVRFGDSLGVAGQADAAREYFRGLAQDAAGRLGGDDPDTLRVQCQGVEPVRGM
jgi:hypothetical protein